MPPPNIPRIAPFNVGDLSETALKDIRQVRLRFAEAERAVGERDLEIQRLTASGISLQEQVETLNATLGKRLAELGNVRQELATQAAVVQDLRAQLDKLQTAAPKIRVQDLVQQFKLNVDAINTQVLAGKTPGMLIDHVEVEVRGGIDVSEGLRIAQLPANLLGATTVSTLKFNLRPSSSLKIVEDEDQG